MKAPGYWFSKNPDKAWGEKFFLAFVPVFGLYNYIVLSNGLLDTGNFWNVAQNVLMWIPYCVLLPWWLRRNRSEEHTSELQSLMRISYAVFCLKKKKQHIDATRIAPITNNPKCPKP